MKKLKFKLMTLFASSAFLIALQSVEVASRKHIYQSEEPEELLAYKRNKR